jgi:hypothetical protein
MATRILHGVPRIFQKRGQRAISSSLPARYAADGTYRNIPEFVCSLLGCHLVGADDLAARLVLRRDGGGFSVSSAPKINFWDSSIPSRGGRLERL